MADRQTLRMRPGFGRQRVGEALCSGDEVTLINATSINILLAGQLTVDLKMRTVQGGSCSGVEPKTAGIESISNRRVVGRITPGGISQHGQRSSVYTRINTVRRFICRTD